MVATKHMTADELILLPDDGYRYELHRGGLIRMAPAGEEHSEVGVNIGALFISHARPRKLGRVYGADIGVILSRNPDIVYAPDVAFVRAGRLPATRRQGFLEIPPDIAVEVVSPSDRESEIQEKVATYLAFGVLQVSVVQPRPRTVTIHEAGQEPHTLDADDVLDGGDILPGFRVRVAELFLTD